MANVPASRRTGFHETPLVGFTALATMGCGMGVAHLLAAALGGSSLALPRTAATLLAALLALALLFSLGHLGRPLRGPLALRRLGRSPLSLEVFAVGSTLVGGALAAALPDRWAGAGWVGWGTSLAASATLLTIGLVYRLPHQHAWRGAVVFQPLAQGALWGWVALNVLTWPPSGSPEQALILQNTFRILLVADTALFLTRMFSLWGGARGLEAMHPRLFGVRRGLLLTRLLLGGILPVALLVSGEGGWALLFLTGAVALDRFVFYGLALPWSTEGEVARVEALLSGRHGEGARP